MCAQYQVSDCCFLEFCVQSESSLDDDAMVAVDEALAAVFRTRFAMKHQRKQKKG